MAEKRDSMGILYKRLKRMRRFRLMSEVVARSSVHYNTVTRIARGEVTDTSVHTFDSIMDAMDAVERELEAEGLEL